MTAKLPLADIRILDLSWSLACPYATMILGDMGAEKTLGSSHAFCLPFINVAFLA
jgi:hypothetical protein